MVDLNTKLFERFDEYIARQRLCLNEVTTASDSLCFEVFVSKLMVHTIDMILVERSLRK